MVVILTPVLPLYLMALYSPKKIVQEQKRILEKQFNVPISYELMEMLIIDVLYEKIRKRFRSTFINHDIKYMHQCKQQCRKLIDEANAPKPSVKHIVPPRGGSERMRYLFPHDREWKDDKREGTKQERGETKR